MAAWGALGRHRSVRTAGFAPERRLGDISQPLSAAPKHSRGESWEFSLMSPARMAIVGVYCGTAVGVQRVVCGPGYEGSVVTFTCPVVTLRPIRAAWSPVSQTCNATAALALALHLMRSRLRMFPPHRFFCSLLCTRRSTARHLC